MGTIKTVHAVHWRENGQICRVAIDSESRKVTLSEGTYSRWISLPELRADRETAHRLLACFEDYLEAHHQTDDDSIPDFSVVTVELSDGAVTFGQLWDLLRSKQVKAVSP